MYLKKLFILKFLIIVILSLFIQSCADSENPLKSETLGWSANKMYYSANNALKEKNYHRAINLYKILETTYPYGVYAQQGLLELAVTYYQKGDPEMALPTINQYIDTYPTSDNMDYALYLKGFINYKNDTSIFAGFTGQDLSERDPINIIEAYKAFFELATRYKDSPYKYIASTIANSLVNDLARGDIYKARYYMGIKAYLAAISRSQNIINLYPQSQSVEEALAIQISAYNKLNLINLKNDIYSILKLNFPKSYFLAHEWQYSDMAWYKFWR